MNSNKLYKQLKNGKQIQLFYKQSESIHYTVWLSFANESYKLHSFHFEGNDVFDDESYQDENIEVFDDFQKMLDRLSDKFPGIAYD